MDENLPLFEAPERQLKERLAADLERLAEWGLFLGGSSWKYEGWLGSIYSRERYCQRGRYSKTRFERECLREYAEVFQIVSGDFAFYQFPTAAFWCDLFAHVAPPFRFAFKAPEEITTPLFPKQPRYGARAGRMNPLFLDAGAFERQFIDPLRPYAERVALIVFEFSAAAAGAFSDARQFAQALARFLGQLPPGFRYGVEIRNRVLFCAEYFAALREHGAAHVFNSWTEMPGLEEQMAIREAFTAEFTACRALITPGTRYEESVTRFAPYSQVREANAAVRNALRELLVRGKRRAEPVFIFVNNRLEGFAPGTIAAVVEEFRSLDRQPV